MLSKLHIVIDTIYSIEGENKEANKEQEQKGKGKVNKKEQQRRNYIFVLDVTRCHGYYVVVVNFNRSHHLIVISSFSFMMTKEENKKK